MLATGLRFHSEDEKMSRALLCLHNNPLGLGQSQCIREKCFDVRERRNDGVTTTVVLLRAPGENIQYPHSWMNPQPP